MVNIARSRVGWKNLIGTPGVSTFFSLDPVAFYPLCRDFFDDLKTYFPSDLDWNFESDGDYIDPLNGDLTGAWTATPLGDIAATLTGGYGAPAGAIVHWNTGTILDGHKLRGRTYLVPIHGSQFGGDGQIASTTLANLQAAATAFVTAAAANFVVWHRPTDAHVGGYAQVTSAKVSSKVAVLRSRRD